MFNILNTPSDGYQQNHVYEEHSHTLQIYWSNRDVISWLAENSDDEHLKKVKQTAEQHSVKMEVSSRPHDESALFDEDDTDEIVLGRSDLNDVEKETSKQRLLSQAKLKPQFEGLRTTPSGHKIQDIRELMTVPVSLLRLHGNYLLIATFYLAGHRHCGFDEEPAGD